MKIKVTDECPECSGYLIRDAGGVDFMVLTHYTNGHTFGINDSSSVEPYDSDDRIYCQDCNRIVDQEASMKAGYIILKPEPEPLPESGIDPKDCCPHCGSNKFVNVTESHNDHTFFNGEWQMHESYHEDVITPLHCAGCRKNVDEEATLEQKCIVLED